MLNATEIKGLIPEGGSLILNFTATKEGKLAVLVNPQYPEKSTPNLNGASEAIKAATAPRLVTGTPEELDNGFMELLNKIVETRNSLATTLEALDKETKEAIEKAKAEGAKKVEEAKKTASKSKVVPPAKGPAKKEADLASPEGEKEAEKREAEEIKAAEEAAGPGVEAPGAAEAPAQKTAEETQQTFSLF